MSEANKELIKRWFEEVWNKRRREAIAEVLASDAVIYEAGETIHGPEGFYPFFDRMQATFTDMQVAFQDAIADADKVCLRWSVLVRHSGGGFGIAPTNTALTTTSGLSLSHRYHAGMRLRTSEYFHWKGLAVFW